MFCYTNLLQRHYKCLKNCVVWRQWRKCRFKSGINVLMMALCWRSVLWVTIGFEQWHKHQECALCCVKWRANSSKNANSRTKLNMNDQCQAQYMAVQHPPYFTDFVTTWLFPVSARLKRVLKGQWFVSAGEVTAKLMRVLTEVSKKGFQKLYEHWQKYVTAQRNYFEWNVV
jgi:hypothetical protein